MTRANAIEPNVHAPSRAAELGVAVFVVVLLVAAATLLWGWIGLVH